MGDRSEWDTVVPNSVKLLSLEENDLFRRRAKNRQDFDDYENASQWEQLPSVALVNFFSFFQNHNNGCWGHGLFSLQWRLWTTWKNCQLERRTLAFAVFRVTDYLIVGEFFFKPSFRCAQCFRPFPDGVYYEFEGRKYCEHDFHVLFAPCCGKCGEFIVGRVIKAMNSNWHPKCFRCGVCSKELADRGFFRNSGRALCHECNAVAKAEGSGKFTCHKCQ